MHAVGIVLACLVCASRGHRAKPMHDHTTNELHNSRAVLDRLQVSRVSSHNSKQLQSNWRVQNSLKVLSMLLLESSPSVGWQFLGRLTGPGQRGRLLEERTRKQERVLSPTGSASEGPIPQLCVLDLDMCVWQPEMYELEDMPNRPIRGDLNGRGEGVIGMHSGGAVIRMFPGALAALQEVADGKYEGMRLAVASSADTPLAERIGGAAMGMLEVLPGVTMKEVLLRGFEDGRNLQIGRQPPLSENKARSHFPILKEKTGIPYDQMLFFDDSYWGDHCKQVEEGCPGVVTQRTPNGMQVEEWRNGFRMFAIKAR